MDEVNNVPTDEALRQVVQDLAGEIAGMRPLLAELVGLLRDDDDPRAQRRPPRTVRSRGRRPRV